MIPEEQPLFDRGHNQPPGLLPLEQAVLEWRAALAEEHQSGGRTFAQRKAELLRAAENAVIRDRETAGAAADVIRIAGRVWQRIYDKRVERTQPYRDTADAIARAAGEFWVDVEQAMDCLLARIEGWKTTEDDRIARQEAEQEAEIRRLRNEAAARAAPLAPVDPAPAPPPAGRARQRPIRGDYGAKVIATAQTTYRVTDVRAVPDHILNSPAVHEAIIGVVRRIAKDMGVPAGIETITSATTQIR